MWDMRRRVRPGNFPRRRIVVMFEFTDVPLNKRHWWLLSEGNEADLCMTDPGFEVDLFIATDVRTMTAVWMGAISLESAMASEALQAHGPTDLRRRLNTWLGLSAFAPIRSSRPVPAVA
jgi:hypothetical protein